MSESFTSYLLLLFKKKKKHKYSKKKTENEYHKAIADFFNFHTLSVKSQGIFYRVIGKRKFSFTFEDRSVLKFRYIVPVFSNRVGPLSTLMSLHSYFNRSVQIFMYQDLEYIYIIEPLKFISRCCTHFDEMNLCQASLEGLRNKLQISDVNTWHI